mmetsp:Transcript_26682/g.78832  ORF Transcript_26682/g.78832 Transcript_26682/m.78832 type:complete len:80 (-) Transcript_26682:1278-1517(-)
MASWELGAKGGWCSGQVSGATDATDNVDFEAGDDNTPFILDNGVGTNSTTQRPTPVCASVPKCATPSLLACSQSSTKVS